MLSRIGRATFVMCFLVNIAYAGVYEDILFAANEKNTDQVVSLLQRGLDVNTADRDGSTLLLIAARTGNVELASFLLKNRASHSRANRYGDTPLLAAAAQGQIAVAEQLIAAGAGINPKGWTPLHYASYGNHAELLKLLLGKGAQVDAVAPNGYTALMMAAISGQNDALKVLLGAGADPGLKNADGLGASDLARQKGFDAAAELIEKSRRR